jgi:GH15 family glucan-1,4-alpha-glucosidase
MTFVGIMSSMTPRGALTVQGSLELLADSQTPAGAIPASTVHEVYRYAWLRDGSWCAYALDRSGNRSAAAAWHRWVASTLLAHEHRVDEALAAVRAGAVNGPVMMPARFTLAGEEEAPRVGEVWPNFQTDCYGFWLWALAVHIQRGGELDDVLERGARLVLRYLIGAGEQPCFDCWEEHPGLMHTSTLAAVAAGMRDAGRLLGDPAAQDAADRLTGRLLDGEFTLAGAFVRSPGDTRVDGSLLWLGVPFAVVEPTSELYKTTVARIRDELLVPAGGVRRYLGDTFYGGSQWILLAASLGWTALTLGDRELAVQLLHWIEASADSDGYLPEQVAVGVQSPHMLDYWRHRWGPTATPLLWSHAMHTILSDELGLLPPARPPAA